jgi:hypothetical protein
MLSMKRLPTIFLLLVVVICATASDKPRVSRGMLAAMEKSLDLRVTRMWDDNPFVLLGPTRGIYLDGYGAVFTAEINLVTGPTMMMRSEVTKEEKDRHRQKRIERLPQLRRALRQALADSAASLDTVPPDEQIVIAVVLSHYPWEDVSGRPIELKLQAAKKKLLEAQRAGGGAALDAVIHFTEY